MNATKPANRGQYLPQTREAFVAERQNVDHAKKVCEARGYVVGTPAFYPLLLQLLERLERTP